jgi:hypothetical protein
MVQITRFLAVLSVAAVGLALSVKRDAATVEADISKISTQVTTLDNAIEAFPLTGGSLVNALVCHFVRVFRSRLKMINRPSTPMQPISLRL